MITQAHLKRILDYDPDTGVFTWRERDASLVAPHHVDQWNGKHSGKVAGHLCESRNGSYYRRIFVNGKLRHAHRLAWIYVHGEDPKTVIDHINQDSTDNRIANLRSVTRELDAKNRKQRTDNRSGVTGVHYSESDGYWVAHININKRKKRLYRGKSFTKAVRLRRWAEKKYGYSPLHGKPREAA